MHRFHVVTIFNDTDCYRRMRSSMAAVGFDSQTCRFTALDNHLTNVHDPYQVLQRLGGDGEEPYVILCHQDLLFDHATSAETLTLRLAHLDELDPAWAIAGTAGGDRGGSAVLHLDDPTGSYRWPTLPHLVVTLDENFLVLRRSQYVRPTPSLSGFHLYGTDLGLNATVQRKSCYVIDFPVHHLSAGDPEGQAFIAAERELVREWRSRLMWGVVKTTCTTLSISFVPPAERVLAARRVRRFLCDHRWTLCPLPSWFATQPTRSTQPGHVPHP
jgi:hypothetical protein